MIGPASITRPSATTASEYVHGRRRAYISRARVGDMPARFTVACAEPTAFSPTDHDAPSTGSTARRSPVTVWHAQTSTGLTTTPRTATTTPCPTPTGP